MTATTIRLSAVLVLCLILLAVSGCSMPEFRAFASRQNDITTKLDRLTGPDISSRQMLYQHCTQHRGGQYRCLEVLP